MARLYSPYTLMVIVHSTRLPGLASWRAALAEQPVLLRSFGVMVLGMVFTMPMDV
jgi:hypothetical protein